MQTSLPETYRLTPKGRRAEDILRSCVHCGFCNATCPTYQLVGDELDGPRGRIYLIKEMLEQQSVDPVAGHHLDRCLTCRACETTCPSGVAYGELLEIGRDFQARQQPRPFFQRLVRRWLLAVVPYPRRFRFFARLGRTFAWFLPGYLREQVPRAARASALPEVPENAQSTVLVLQGCVQQVATPGVNQALAELLTRHGVGVVYAEQESCCGGLPLHLGEEDSAVEFVRSNLRGLQSILPDVDAVISTASGCGVTLADYERLLDADDELAGCAQQLVAKLVDVSELLTLLDLPVQKLPEFERVAVHLPCTLQHGRKLGGDIGPLLEKAGYQLIASRDGHLCCGSAGTYAVLQSEMSAELRTRKLERLQENQPDVIATANVGCQMHLGAAAEVPVRHWLELLT